MEGMTVEVKVGYTLREYLVAINGSPVLEPEKDSLLWGLLKQHLVTGTSAYRPVPEQELGEYIRIRLRPTTNARTYSVADDRMLGLNTLFRCYLTSAGENRICRFLMEGFKKSFHDYMTGALNNNPEMKIKDAIGEFCTDKKLRMEFISFEMLTRDWHRYRNKQYAKKVALALI